MKKTILLLILLIVLIAAGAIFLFYNKDLVSTVLSPQKPVAVTIQDKQITDNTKPFVIKITYPEIAGLDDFNQRAKAIIDKEISDFKTNSLANDEAVKQTDPTTYAAYPREYELDISYTKGVADSNMVSVIFNVYNFEGGAHGASYFIPLNYNPNSKQEIKLADLFPNQPDYLQKISAFCIKDLTKQVIDKMESVEGSWIQDGAGPTEINYQFFLINKDNLVFYFPQYQIAPGVAGDFEVTYPR